MLNLYFTNDEMKNFLSKEGYTIKTVKGWKSYNTYHNQVENNEYDVQVAFRGELNEFNDSNGSYRMDSLDKHKIETVFSNVIKSKLLNL